MSNSDFSHLVGKEDKEIKEELNEKMDIDGFIKYDNGKTRWDLLPLYVIEPMVRVLQKAIELKGYDDYNWMKMKEDDWKRFYSALIRHANDIQEGENLNKKMVIDGEFNEHHAACIMCNAMFLLYHFQKFGKN